jgi:hypothetical protein
LQNVDFLDDIIGPEASPGLFEGRSRSQVPATGGNGRNQYAHNQTDSAQSCPEKALVEKRKLSDAQVPGVLCRCNSIRIVTGLLQSYDYPLNHHTAIRELAE